MRLTLPLKLFVTQTKRLPAKIPIGLLPTAIGGSDLSRREVDAADAVVVAVGDPEEPVAEREALRPRSDGEGLLLRVALRRG